MMLRSVYGAAAAALLATLPVSAVALGTVDFEMTHFESTELKASQDDYKKIRAANFAAVFAVEDFEGLTVRQIGSDATATLDTKVGSFTTLGGKGSGTTAIDEANAKGANRGKNIAIRQNGDTHNNGGRQNTSFTSGQDKTYLDSNDTLGFRWVAALKDGTMFDRLLFTLTDPGDQGKTLTIKAVDYEESFTIKPRQRNGEIFNFLVEFSRPVTMATLLLEKSGTNDGVSIDNITVGVVPLPASVLLLLGVSGALVAGKRQSARRAA